MTQSLPPDEAIRLMSARVQAHTSGDGGRVRRYHPKDAAAVVALFRDTVRRVNIRDYSPDQVRAWAPDDLGVGWAGKLAGRFTVLVEAGGSVLGFADLEDDGHFDHLFVHADFQRCGVGRALVAVVEDEARRRGLRRIFTEASITARPFFERQGYVVLQEQTVHSRGQAFINYRMEKILETAPDKEPLPHQTV